MEQQHLSCFFFVFCIYFCVNLAGYVFCSADGHYELKLNTKAIVHHNGLVAWKPPATYKSACDIDVEYFPLDIQTCFLKLGSWTYAGYQVRRTYTSSCVSSSSSFLSSFLSLKKSFVA